MKDIRPLISSNFEESTEYYTVEEFLGIYDKFIGAWRDTPRFKKIAYVDVPAAFDIETTSSTNENGEKAAWMYVWQFGIAGAVIIGRKWEDFQRLIDFLSKYFSLSDKRRLLVYVHNLEFEFAFIARRFEWANVFAVDRRRPLYALTMSGIEFRCSYLQTGLSLEKVGENLLTYKIRKLKGDLDYDLVRTADTPLTEQEIAYCVNDVKVLMAWECEKAVEVGGIQKIQLTKTGEVRAYVRKMCYGSGKGASGRYHNLMKELTLDPDEYRMLKKAFTGGFTHASSLYSGKVLENVSSIDFTSSYPAVMVAEQYPMGRAIYGPPKDREEFEKWLRIYCCVFDVCFTNIRPKIYTEHPLSFSKCKTEGDVVKDNGRIIFADKVYTTVTEQDWFILSAFYDWDNFQISKNFYRYPKAYLPKPIIESILTFYEAKTALKGVPGKEAEYMVGKGMLNGVYGMTVTDICKDEQIFNGFEWEQQPVNIDEAIDNYNNSKNRFLFYPWGVWVTAYARRNLFSGIVAIGEDYIYADTDSIKCLNIEKHQEYISKYNKRIKEKISTALKEQGFDPSRAAPKTIKGEEKPLGVWDDDGHYDKFKTLGAKRYLTETDGKISLTLAGVGKKAGREFLENLKAGTVYIDGKKKRPVEPFRAFTEGIMFPGVYFITPPAKSGPEARKSGSGKLIRTYIDEHKSGTAVDYLGNIGRWEEYTAAHLSPADYSLTLAEDYRDLLLSLAENTVSVY